MIKRFRIILIFCLSLTMSFGQGENVIDLKDSDYRLEIGEVYLLEQEGEFIGKLVPWSDLLEVGSYKIELNFNNNHESDSLFVLETTQGGLIKAQINGLEYVSGRSIGFEEKGRKSVNNTFDLKIPKGEKQKVILEIENSEANGFEYAAINLSVISKTSYRSVNKSNYKYSLLFIGAILVMTLYNFVLFILLRNKSYLFYVLNNVLIVLFVLAQLGWLTDLFFDNAENHNTFLAVLGSFQFVFYLLFTRNILNIEELRPKLFKQLGWLTIIYPSLLLLMFINEMLTVAIGGVIALIFYNYILYLSIKLIKEGYKPAKSFLYANLSYYSGIFISLLMIGGVLPSRIYEFTPINFVEIGTTIQLFLFSLTLASRISLIRSQLANEKLSKEILLREQEQEKLAIIEEKNEELEEKVFERTKELRQINKDMVDSINYARHIQNSILPSQEKLKKVLPDHFLLYKPKDIVSGDFYWCHEHKEEVEDKVVFAVVDCTGHGVPGAMMSLVGVAALNKIVKEEGVMTSDEILNRLKKEVYYRLNADGTKENKEGMDLGVCVYDKKNKTLDYSGAYNSMFYIQNQELKELKGNNIHVGGDLDGDKYTRHTININTPTQIYLFTDGFQDQFGGVSNKKFKKSRLKELLLAIHNEPLDLQKKTIHQTFESYKGSEEQIDDVTLMGGYLS